MKEINVDFIEQTEEGLVKKNFTTKMKLVDGLEATIQGLESQIANAGKVDSVNNKQGNVVLTGSDLMISMSWSEKISDVLLDMYSNKADKTDVEQLKKELEAIGGKAFHDAFPNTIKESTAPNEFSQGITLCWQSSTSNFPTIGESGVSITFVGSRINYGQIFITDNGDMWSRRSGVNNSWSGKWYNAKREIDKKANTHHTHYAHDIFDNTTSKTQLEINKELFQSGVESNKSLVDALNSKGVSASTSDTIKTNVGKVENIQLATGNASRSDVLSGRTFSNSSNTGLTGTMTNNGSLNRTISMQNGSVNVSPGYYSGGQVKANITNLTSGNIRKGVNVGGVQGSFVGVDLTSITHRRRRINKGEAIRISLRSDASERVDFFIASIGEFFSTQYYVIFDRENGLVLTNMSKSEGSGDKFYLKTVSSTYVTIVNEDASSISSDWNIFEGQYT